jgi:hypothetical protein
LLSISLVSRADLVARGVRLARGEVSFAGELVSFEYHSNLAAIVLWALGVHTKPATDILAISGRTLVHGLKSKLTTPETGLPDRAASLALTISPYRDVQNQSSRSVAPEFDDGRF